MKDTKGEGAMIIIAEAEGIFVLENLKAAWTTTAEATVMFLTTEGGSGRTTVSHIKEITTTGKEEGNVAAGPHTDHAKAILKGHESAHETRMP